VTLKTKFSPNAFDEIIKTAAEVTKLFTKNGFQLYFVGGIVRDLLLGIRSDIQDLDCTTDALPEEIKGIVQEIADAVWLQGERFGTIGMRLGDVNFEITTHRAEAYVDDSRNPIVQFSNDLTNDLMRRDFTVNAIAVDARTAELYDPYNGIKDLEEKILQTPMDPKESFNDDPLRILRAARFISNYKLTPTLNLVEAAQKVSKRIDIVSVERVRDEIFRLLSTKDPGLGFEFLFKSKVISYVLPELSSLGDLERKELISQVVAVDPNPLLRLAVFKEKIPESRLRTLRFSTKEIEYVEKIKKALLVLEQKYESKWPDQELRKLAFDFNDVLDPVMGLWAKISPDDSALINGITRLQEKGELNSFEPFFDGLKIMEELGIEPGPDVGLATDWLVQLQIQEGLLSEEEVKQKLHNWWNSRTT
jgi:poly(A) polymerase